MVHFCAAHNLCLDNKLKPDSIDIYNSVDYYFVVLQFVAVALFGFVSGSNCIHHHNDCLLFCFAQNKLNSKITKKNSSIKSKVDG